MRGVPLLLSSAISENALSLSLHKRMPVQNTFRALLASRPLLGALDAPRGSFLSRLSAWQCPLPAITPLHER